MGLLDITQVGLPHSDISGSLPACGSPKLFAAYRVLLRLLAPRHPPYALSNLTFARLLQKIYSFYLREHIDAHGCANIVVATWMLRF
jgi:hypothetical protein